VTASELRAAADTLTDASTTGTYGDPCGECGMPGAFIDAVAMLLRDFADHVPWTLVLDDHPALAVARAVNGEGTL
jgi:hypothetical protein